MRIGRRRGVLQRRPEIGGGLADLAFAEIELRRLADLGGDLVDIRLARLLDRMPLDFRRHAPHRRRELSEMAQKLRQVLGPDHDQGDHCDHQKFRVTHAEIKHERAFRSKSAAPPARSPLRPLSRAQPCASRFASVLSGASASWSMVRTVLSAGFDSSSCRPRLKLLIPFATSPIMLEILLLPPNRSSTTTSRMSQCQIEKLPIIQLLRCRFSPRATGRGP